MVECDAGARRHYGVIAALITAVFMIGGCARPVSSGTPFSSSEPSPSPPSSAVARARCNTSQLGIDLAAPGFGAGNVGAWIRFTNKSTVPCQLHGWPRLVGVNATGETQARQTNTVMTFPSLQTPPTVLLAPNETAYAAFEGSDTPPDPGVKCPSDFLTLEVTPPGDTTPVSLSAWNDWLGAYQPACAGLEVTMIVSTTDVPSDQLPYVEPSSTP